MTTLATPQPLQALALANRVRSERAQLKRRLNRGALLLADALRDPPACLESRLDSTRGELERTRERLREAERERDEWKRDAQHLERSCRRLSRRLTALREAVEEIVERWDDAEAREHPAATHRRLRHALDSLDERGGRDG